MSKQAQTAHKTRITLDKHCIYVSGLPRAGSTLLCQLLGHHPDVYSIGHSSPLAATLENLRYTLSDNSFLLSQLDVDFDTVYTRLLNAYRGFINGWFAETSQQWVVDKNRGWMSLADTLHVLDPDFKMLVCVRDPVQIYGSIEQQHQKTILLDFPDHLAGHTRYGRADNLFGNKGVIGGPLRTIQSIQDLPQDLQNRFYFVVFEHLMHEPETALAEIFTWLGLPAAEIDMNNLASKPHESDSHYRFKYRHKTHTSLSPPKPHQIPKRIEADIHQNFAWLYELFYPGLVKK